MNKTLTVLMNKLSWQVQEINEQLQTLNQQIINLEKKLSTIEVEIQKACVIPTVIYPEREIAGLNFIMRSRAQAESLREEKKILESQSLQLQTRQIRLKAEIKMLDNYREKQQKISTKKKLAKQQNDSDEWTLSRRKPK
jgi:hypothetical protein